MSSAWRNCRQGQPCHGLGFVDQGIDGALAAPLLPAFEPLMLSLHAQVTGSQRLPGLVDRLQKALDSLQRPLQLRQMAGSYRRFSLLHQQVQAVQSLGTFAFWLSGNG